MTFIEQMKNDFIPSVEKMLEKERIHLVSLLHNKQKMENRNMNDCLNDINHMIEKSKQMVMHFEQRLSEYRHYVNNSHVIDPKKQKKIKQIKLGFKSFFQGVGDLYPQYNSEYIHVSRFEITNFDFNFKYDDETARELIEVTITLGSPGLLIGRSGKTIDELTKYLSTNEYDVKILIKESDLWKY